MKRKITNHAKERMQERCKFTNRNIRKETFNVVIDHGITPNDVKITNKPLYDYMINKQNRYNNSKVKIYNDFVYIFKNKKLLTVYELPEKYRNMEEIK